MQTVWGVADERMIVPHVGEKGMKYGLRFADELVYAPMVSNFLVYVTCCMSTSGTLNEHHFLCMLKGIFYPSTFCLPDDQVLMEGQPQPIVLQEDVFDEVHWAAEQVSDCMKCVCMCVIVN